MLFFKLHRVFSKKLINCYIIPKGEIKNGYFRDTGSIAHARQRTKTNKQKRKQQKQKTKAKKKTQRKHRTTQNTK